MLQVLTTKKSKVTEVVYNQLTLVKKKPKSVYNSINGDDKHHNETVNNQPILQSQAILKTTKVLKRQQRFLR